MSERPLDSDVTVRADVLYAQMTQAVRARASRVFAALMVLQWVVSIGVALVLSPYAWEGRSRSIHMHVYAAVFLGGAISSLPFYLCMTRPTDTVTKHVVAVGQMCWSALLIHLSGGRIETHFHVFGSLAFIAFLYRDWVPLIPASLVVAADHFVRGLLWPESVYGVSSPEWWRFLEHAGWVAFEDAVLVFACIESTREVRQIARRRAELELLAASVGHQLRNPLASIRNANAYLTKKLATLGTDSWTSDPKLVKMTEIVDREVAQSSEIVSDLIDFARMRPPSLRPCPLPTLVDDAIQLVRAGKITIVNEVPVDLPVPEIDKDQFLKVMVNVLKNAVESHGKDAAGTVVVNADGGGDSPWTIRVIDHGRGIPSDVMDKVFDPLFTTKTSGTGLGLAIVHGLVRGHKGAIKFERTNGVGTTVSIVLPPTTPTNGATT